MNRLSHFFLLYHDSPSYAAELRIEKIHLRMRDIYHLEVKVSSPATYPTAKGLLALSSLACTLGATVAVASLVDAGVLKNEHKHGVR